jgi:hypothetical protein
VLPISGDFSDLWIHDWFPSDKRVWHSMWAVLKGWATHIEIGCQNYFLFAQCAFTLTVLWPTVMEPFFTRRTAV